MTAATIAQNGRVTTQASMIARKTFQLTPPRPLPSPVPVTADVMTCVVDTGSPKCEARKMMRPPPISALNPLMGCNLVIFSPSVRISRKDLTDRKVPMAMAPAAARITQMGTPYSSTVLPDRAARKMTMMPMTLVASLEPWLNDTQLDDPICSHLNMRSAHADAQMREAPQEAADSHQDEPDEDAQERRQEERDEHLDERRTSVSRGEARARPARNLSDLPPERETN